MKPWNLDFWEWWHGRRPLAVVKRDSASRPRTRPPRELCPTTCCRGETCYNQRIAGVGSWVAWKEACTRIVARPGSANRPKKAPQRALPTYPSAIGACLCQCRYGRPHSEPQVRFAEDRPISSDTNGWWHGGRPGSKVNAWPDSAVPRLRRGSSQRAKSKSPYRRGKADNT